VIRGVMRGFYRHMDLPAVMPYVTGFLNEVPHFHASDAFWEYGDSAQSAGWHIDGTDNGYRRLGPYIPLVQLKIAYFLVGYEHLRLGPPDRGAGVAHGAGVPG